MPVKNGKDTKGCFAQWGSQGAKYYFTCGNESSKNNARRKAHLQGAAAKKAGFTEELKESQDQFMKDIK